MLKLNNVEVYYGNVQALKGISLEVGDGELVALIGSNGAGKTTTLKTISGLMRPRTGSIEYCGEKIDHLAPYHILERGICQVPEGREVFPDMTVMENLEMGAHRAKKNKPFKVKLAEVFEYFPRLAERRKQLAKTLSGGEQQMLAIARGLMSEPKLLLLDEPSLGLAPLLIEHMAEIVDLLHKSGLSILLVEQNAHLALELADRGYVLETGQVILEDQAKNLLNNEKVQKAYLGI